jgi:hypothetical protein
MALTSLVVMPSLGSAGAGVISLLRLVALRRLVFDQSGHPLASCPSTQTGREILVEIFSMFSHVLEDSAEANGATNNTETRTHKDFFGSFPRLVFGSRKGIGKTAAQKIVYGSGFFMLASFSLPIALSTAQLRGSSPYYLPISSYMKISVMANSLFQWQP